MKYSKFQNQNIVVKKINYFGDILSILRLNPERYPYLLQSSAKGNVLCRYDILFSFPQKQIILNFEDIIIGARRGSPLAVGYSKDENYLGSDSYALKSMTNKISYLDDGDICVLTKDNVSFYDVKKNKINKEVFILSDDKNISDKGDYKNFMSKEIFEQPITAKNCIHEYVDKIRDDVNFYNFPIKPKSINSYTKSDIFLL